MRPVTYARELPLKLVNTLKQTGCFTMFRHGELPLKLVNTLKPEFPYFVFSTR